MAVSTVMMYVLPMLLGQTYDLGKERPGLMIYNPSKIDKDVTTVEHYFTDYQYRMVTNSADVKDFMDISGKLSLKIKGGMIDVSGEGQYLKDSSTKTNGLEILIKMHFETVTKTIPRSLTPRLDWRDQNKDYLGTHYCRSITYGGDMLAVVRVSASNSYDMEKIKGAINGAVKTSGFSAEVKARLDKLRNESQDMSSMEIDYYASVPIHGVSHDIDGLMTLVEAFPKYVKQVNNGQGNPLRMELYPLSALNNSYPDYMENRALTDLLEDLEDQFDDLRATRKEIGTWLSGLPPTIPTDTQKEIDAFMTKVNNIFGVYMETIGKLDLSQKADTAPLYDAVKKYKADGEYVLPQKYIRQLRKLQTDIYKAHPELKPRTGGAQFFHWGRRVCESEELETVVSGVMLASSREQSGRFSDYICSPVAPELDNATTHFPNITNGDKYYDVDTFVGPLKYVGGLERYKFMKAKTIGCASCRANARTTLLVEPGSKTCPSKKWTKEYEGILMAPDGQKGSYICVDLNMQEPKGNITFKGEEPTEIQEVTMMCGDLPCASFKPKKAIPCVVCTF